MTKKKTNPVPFVCFLGWDVLMSPAVVYKEPVRLDPAWEIVKLDYPKTGECYLDTDGEIVKCSRPLFVSDGPRFIVKQKRVLVTVTLSIADGLVQLPLRVGAPVWFDVEPDREDWAADAVITEIHTKQPRHKFNPLK